MVSVFKPAASAVVSGTLAIIGVSRAGILCHETFAGVGNTFRDSINGFNALGGSTGLTGTWALAGGGNEDIISRATTTDFSGASGGSSPDTVGSRQHWWEQRDVWGDDGGAFEVVEMPFPQALPNGEPARFLRGQVVVAE